MSRNAKRFLMVGLALGLLPAGLAGAGKPPSPAPTCPDCTIVYSLGSANTGADLVLMKEDGTQKTLLLAGARDVLNTHPTWSPSGDWIAFQRYAAGRHEVWVVRWDGQFATKVAGTCFGSDRVAWSPGSGDRYWIAYTDTPRGADGACGASGGVADLWAVEVDLGNLGNPVLTGEPVCMTCSLTSHSRRWCDPAWSRSSTFLAAHLTVETPAGIRWPVYVFKLAFDPYTGAPSVVEDATWPWLIPPPEGQDGIGGEIWAHWSDSLAVCTTPERSLWRIDLDLDNRTASYQPLTPGSGFKVGPSSWSPNDDRFLCWAAPQKFMYKYGFYIVSFGPEPIFKLILSGGDEADWRP